MSNSDLPSTTESEMDLCYDGNQLGLLENFNLPFPLNMNFDDISMQKNDSSQSNLNNLINIGGKKRAMLDAAALEASKKRFVWPDALHRDFLAAVFDIGLKYASPKEVAQLLAEPDAAAVTTDQMKSHLQKFSVFRERKEGYVAYFDLQRGTGGASTIKSENHTINGSTSFPPEYSSSVDMNPFAPAKTEIEYPLNGKYDNRSPTAAASKDTSVSYRDTKDKPRAAGGSGSLRPQSPRPPPTVSPAALLARVDNLGEAITLQNNYLSNIKQLIKKQAKLYSTLAQKANQLRSMLPASQTSTNTPLFNTFNNLQVRNTCSTLYKMNIVTGDSSFGLSYIDNTTRNMFNDSCNYNYYNECVAHLNYMRNGGIGANPNTAVHNMHNRSGVHFMQEMRNSMEIHRKQLIKKVDQLSQHGASDLLSLYGNDEGCTSGYNSFTDHHKYNGYVYTEDDNKLCYAGAKKYRFNADLPEPVVPPAEGVYHIPRDRSRSNSASSAHTGTHTGAHSTVHSNVHSNVHNNVHSSAHSGTHSNAHSINTTHTHNANHNGNHGGNHSRVHSNASSQDSLAYSPAIHQSDLSMHYHASNSSNHHSTTSSTHASHQTSTHTSTKTSPEDTHTIFSSYRNGYTTDGIASQNSVNINSNGSSGAMNGVASAPAWETELDLDLFFFLADDPPTL